MPRTQSSNRIQPIASHGSHDGAGQGSIWPNNAKAGSRGTNKCCGGCRRRYECICPPPCFTRTAWRSCFDCMRGGDSGAFTNALVGLLRAMIAIVATVCTLAHFTSFPAIAQLLAPDASQSTTAYQLVLIASAWVRAALGGFLGLMVLADATVLHHGAFGDLSPTPDNTVARRWTLQAMADSFRMPPWLLAPCAPRAWHGCGRPCGRCCCKARCAPPSNIVLDDTQQQEERGSTQTLGRTVRSRGSLACCGCKKCPAWLRVQVPSKVALRAILLLALAASPSCVTFFHARRAMEHVQGIAITVIWLATAALQLLPCIAAALVVVLSQLPGAKVHRWLRAVTTTGGGGEAAMLAAKQREAECEVTTGTGAGSTSQQVLTVHQQLVAVRSEARMAAAAEAEAKRSCRSRMWFLAKAAVHRGFWFRCLAATFCLAAATWHLILAFSTYGAAARSTATADASQEVTTGEAYTCDGARARMGHIVAAVLSLLLGGAAWTRASLGAGVAWLQWFAMLLCVVLVPSPAARPELSDTTTTTLLRSGTITLFYAGAAIVVLGFVTVFAVTSVCFACWWCCCCCCKRAACSGGVYQESRKSWSAGGKRCRGRCKVCCFLCFHPFEWGTALHSMRVWLARHALGIGLGLAAIVLPLCAGSASSDAFEVEWTPAPFVQDVNATMVEVKDVVEDVAARVLEWINGASVGVAVLTHDAIICTLIIASIVMIVIPFMGAVGKVMMQAAKILQKVKKVFTLIKRFRKTMLRALRSLRSFVNLLRYRPPTRLVVAAGTLRIILMLTGPLLTTVLGFTVAYFERTRLRGTRVVLRALTAALLVLNVAVFLGLLAFQVTLQELGHIIDFIIDGDVKPLPAWKFLLASYAVAAVACLALLLAALSAPQDLDDPNTLELVDESRMAAVTRAPQDERVHHRGLRSPVGGGAGAGAGAGGRRGSGGSLGGRRNSGGSTGSIATPGPPQLMDASDGAGAVKVMKQVEAEQEELTSAAREGLYNAAQQEYMDDLVLHPSSGGSGGGGRAQPAGPGRQGGHLRYTNRSANPLERQLRNRVALMHTPKRCLSPWVVHLWFGLVLAVAITSLSPGYTWWTVEIQRDAEVAGAMGGVGTLSAQDDGKVALGEDDSLCDVIGQLVNTFVTFILDLLPDLSPLVDEAKAFAALFALPVPAFPSADAAAPFFVFIPLIMGAGLWYWYWFQQATDLPNCWCCRRRQYANSIRPTPHVSRLRRGWRLPLHMVLGMMLEYTVMSLSALLWWSNGMQSLAERMPFVDAKVTTGAGLELGILVHLLVLVGAGFILIEHIAPAQPPTTIRVHDKSVEGDSVERVA